MLGWRVPSLSCGVLSLLALCLCALMRVNTGGPFKLRQTVTVANPVILTMHGQGYGEAYPKLVCPSGAGISLVLRYLSICMYANV